MNGLVLDAMGVIFQAADDVGELLVPFIEEQTGSVDRGGLKQHIWMLVWGEQALSTFGLDLAYPLNWKMLISQDMPFSRA